MKIMLKNIIRKTVSSSRRCLLTNKDFTIISDNCWGSFTYQYFNLPYTTPFVGLFIFSPDYIKLLKDLKKYINMKITFIQPEQSKYKDELIKNNTLNTYPIGLLDDVEIHFLHYKSEKEAEEKWIRRSKRINYENLIVKFCDRDIASKELIREFSELNYERKVLLTSKNNQIKSGIVLKDEYGAFIEDEWKNFLSSVNPIRLLNDFYS